MKNFVSIMNIPSPYRVYLFEKLQEAARERDCSLCVHFMAKSHKERPLSWRNPKMSFRHKYWADCGWRHHHFNPFLIMSLMWKKCDVLLVGTPFDTFTGILAALLLRATVKICWIEGNTKTPGVMDGFLGCFKRFIISKFDYVAVPGVDAARYIGLHQKATKRVMPQVVFLPNLIDETKFKPRCLWNINEIVTKRRSLNAGEDEKVCLVPARLSSVKGLLQFIEAIDEKMLRKWRIVIIGQGEQKQEIEQLSSNKHIADRIMILDYVDYAEMPLYYAASDLFLLPSIHDPNPLSVPEALHSGLPVALSDQLGNVEEGVTDGENGWVLPVLKKDEYKKALIKVFSASFEELKHKGSNSLLKNARFWSSDKSINNFLDVIGLKNKAD